MRLILGLKDLFKNYLTIMPTYLAATLLMLVVSNAFPVLGTIAFLPITVGISFVMLRAIVFKTYHNVRPIGYGFRRGYYGKNLIYLLIRQMAYLAPLAAGGLISAFFFGLYGDANTRIGVAVLNILFFSLPSVLISLMLAMVPFLLADPKFNQKKHSPLKVSARIMKGNYLKLVLIRLFFLPWLALNISGLAVAFSSLYTRIFGTAVLGFEAPSGGLLSSSLAVTLVMYLLFLPWYRMMHAELYVKLRYKVKGYR